MTRDLTGLTRAVLGLVIALALVPVIAKAIPQFRHDAAAERGNYERY